jgi:hypothetical protein
LQVEKLIEREACHDDRGNRKQQSRESSERPAGEFVHHHGRRRVADMSGPLLRDR